MKQILMAVLLVGSCLGADYRTGKVTKFEGEPYSQSAHIVRNRAVYWVQADSVTFKITRRKDKGRIKMEVGQQVQFRTDDATSRRDGKHGIVAHMFIADGNGQETEYDIIGESN